MSGTQLTIHISRTSVHVAEVLRSSKEIIRAESTTLHESNPTAYKEKLSSFFDQQNFDKDYEEVTVAWSTNLQALIPLRVYNDSDPKAIHQLLFGNAGDDRSIDFNRLMELSMVSVFEIPDWVKSFFVIKYPRVTIKHEHAMMLRATFQSSVFDRAIHISLCDDYMNIFLVHHNELKFSNAFEYQTTDDILYHAMYVMEQEGWKDENIKLAAYYLSNDQKDVLNDFKQKLTVMKSSDQLKVEEFTNSLTIQPLCV